MVVMATLTDLATGLVVRHRAGMGVAGGRAGGRAVCMASF